MEEFKHLTKLAARFKGFKLFAAFVTLCLIALIYFLFSPGSFDSIIPERKFQIFFFIILFLLILVIFVVFVFTRKKRAIVYFTVHEKNDKTAGLGDANVALALPEPVKKKTQENGSVNLIVPEQYIGKKVHINAWKSGYEKGTPSEIKLRDGMHEFISLAKNLAPHKPDKKELKEYLFISKRKVDMYWSQLPEEITSNIGSDKLDKFSKVEIIADYIVKDLDTGTIQEPKTFFKGILPMKATIINGDGSSYAYFGGTDGKHAVILVGSPNHILDGAGIRILHGADINSAASGTSRYFTNEILSAFNFKANELEPSDILDASINEVPEELRLHSFVGSYNFEIQGPPQKLEFLARLLHTNKNGQGVLGTPIYVALA